ncbi:orotidine 5'-phosphate decarboxylase, putative [Plasmodium ovale]|uniref:Orotidine 5'-phosphate decarboxylase n=2 Tax=Plasmodium ovale TaxID=36330 RepID=A0A1A8VMD3_PLAOA|nr:orotidine 5'-phosphate decarboxylase, putative (OMPDC) [Plasmodium ovale curtisi]SBS83991.1 orotidine 5'-phosphate decarboxylase, putative (OMPDC) [Plasmodium ovale curtisi]SCP03863.1 orotidine 5'-phosphate decarboxylase, putative [Plasmodium ovale]
MNFQIKLKKRRREVNTCLCIGLDPDEDDIKNFMQNEEQNGYKNVKNNWSDNGMNNIEMLKEKLLGEESLLNLQEKAKFFYFFNHFCFYIINITKKYALAYKMNLAFYIPYGSVGMDVLKNVFDYLNHMNIPTILDMKINDIGNTVKNYRKFIFEYLKSDSCTVNIYMGTDMLKDICFDEEKQQRYSAFVLIKTTNKDSFLFQNELSLSDKPAYLVMAEEAQKMSIHLKMEENKEFIGFVVGSNSFEEMKMIRHNFPDCYILAPGIGAQNGDLYKTLKNGYSPNYEKILINVGRAITKNAYPQKASEAYYNKINQIFKELHGHADVTNGE